MARIIDTLAQFQKLCQSYSRCDDFTKQQMLEIVEDYLAIERSLSERGHWAYCLNKHLALAELRGALVIELELQKISAEAKRRVRDRRAA